MFYHINNDIATDWKNIQNLSEGVIALQWNDFSKKPMGNLTDRPLLGTTGICGSHAELDKYLFPLRMGSKIKKIVGNEFHDRLFGLY